MDSKNGWHFFFKNKILVFLDSMQFMNSSLDKVVKNVSHESFKYLVEEFVSQNLELLKEKGAYLYEYMSSFEKSKEEDLPARKYVYSPTKNGKISDDGKISDGHIIQHMTKIIWHVKKLGINLK